MTGSLGRTVAHLSMDDAYLRSRQERHAPRHAVDGLMSGSIGLASGVVEGLTGLISAPLEGAHTEGLAGFVKGVGKGLVGVAVKPAAGVFDLASRTAEGVARSFELGASPYQRLRPPRMLHGPERAIHAYSRFEGLAHMVLLGIREGAYLAEELLLSLQLLADELLLLTSGRLITASLLTLKCQRHYPLKDVSAVSAAGSALVLTLKAYGPRKEVRLACPNPETCGTAHRVLELALTASEREAQPHRVTHRA